MAKNSKKGPFSVNLGRTEVLFVIDGELTAVFLVLRRSKAIVATIHPGGTTREGGGIPGLTSSLFNSLSICGFPVRLKEETSEFANGDSSLVLKIIAGT